MFGDPKERRDGRDPRRPHHGGGNDPDDHDDGDDGDDGNDPDGHRGGSNDRSGGRNPRYVRGHRVVWSDGPEPHKLVEITFECTPDDIDMQEYADDRCSSPD